MLLISDHSMLSDFRHLTISVESQWSYIKLADFLVFPYISCASSLVLTRRGKKIGYYSHPSFSLLSRIFFLPKPCADCFCCHLGFCAMDSFLLLSDLFRRRAVLRGQRSMVAVSLNFLHRQSKASKGGQTFIICDVYIVVVSRCSLISSGSQMLLLLGFLWGQSSHKHQSRSRKSINMVCSTFRPKWQLGLFHSCSGSHVQKVSIALWNNPKIMYYQDQVEEKNLSHVLREFSDEKLGRLGSRVDASHWEEIIVKQRNLLLFPHKHRKKNRCIVVIMCLCGALARLAALGAGVLSEGHADFWLSTQ